MIQSLLFPIIYGLHKLKTWSIASCAASQSWEPQHLLTYSCFYTKTENPQKISQGLCHHYICLDNFQMAWAWILGRKAIRNCFKLFNFENCCGLANGLASHDMWQGTRYCIATVQSEQLTAGFHCWEGPCIRQDKTISFLTSWCIQYFPWFDLFWGEESIFNKKLKDFWSLAQHNCIVFYDTEQVYFSFKKPITWCKFKNKQVTANPKAQTLEIIWIDLFKTLITQT